MQVDLQRGAGLVVSLDLDLDFNIDRDGHLIATQEEVRREFV